MSVKNNCKHCNSAPIEWVDEYCQECWEDYCSRTWWEMVDKLAGGDSGNDD